MKRALITGATGALGVAMARQVSAAGFHVYVHASGAGEDVDRLVAELQAAGGSASSVCFDVTQRDEVTAALDHVIAHDGPIQAVVNNAGIHVDAPLAGMSWTQWQRVIDVSLNGFFNVTQPLLLPMIRTRWGRVINISSLAAVAGNAGQVNYAAAKAGLHGATKALAKEVASRGISVNAIAPGIIASPSSAAAFSAERIAELCPMKRSGTPDEVASLVTYLLSESAGYISGQIISIDGAMT